MKTVLITGCSSGFGRETATYFLDRGWRVIATMRNPQEGILPRSEALEILPLDVTKPESIAELARAVGRIDALVNNAGQGMIGVLEATDIDVVRSLFEINTIGTMAVCKALLPQLRESGDGVIVNVSSSTTFVPLPMLSVYTATKAAIEAFTRSLALELQAVGVRARLVMPGRSPETGFRNNALRISEMPEAYGDFAKTVFAQMSNDGEITLATDVAEAIWRAVTDPNAPMDAPTGADAVAIAASVRPVSA